MENRIKKAIMELSESSSLQMFVVDERSFYKKYFDRFTSSVIREKKMLVFENPNRIKVTYEFDVQGLQDEDEPDAQSLQNEDKPLFIFLPNARKNWLKIMWKGQRLSVCNADDVKKAVWKVVKDDVNKVKQTLNEKDENVLWDKKIWGEKERLPCFVNSSTLSEKDGQLVVEFYDSFDSYKHKGLLFDERCYDYEYGLDAGLSHWIYVKAPEKFQITLNTADERAIVIKGNDPEIKAYHIFHTSKTEPVRFNIEVRVPETLKWWYWMIVSLAIGFIVAFSKLGIELVGKETTALPPAFAQVGISLVAAIIATRGWIMNDETVLKRVSIIMTVLAALILIILFAMYSVVVL